jgi:MFS family permease
VQAIASSIMWIVGTTTVANNVPIQHIGKAYAMVSIATSVGFSLGPMLSGMLLQAVGYWAAWSSAFCILSIDVVFRLLMVEKPDQKETGLWSPAAWKADLCRNRCNLHSLT